MNQLPDEVLESLGFKLVPSPYAGDDVWTHKRGRGKFYFHLLTPECTSEALINIGKTEMKEAVHDAISSIDL